MLSDQVASGTNPPIDTQTTQTPPASGGDQPWFSSIADEPTRNWVESKGFKDSSSLAQSAYNLEKLLGHDRAGRTLVMPGDDATPEQIAEYRTKIGVPSKADEYKLPVPEGHSDAFSKTAAQWFHESGISAKQGQELAAKWNAYSAEAFAKQESEFATRSTQEMESLKTEWGAAYDQNSEIARRAAHQFLGGDAKKLDAIERALGTGETMKLLAHIGRGLGEHKTSFDTDGGQFGVLTPGQAKARIEQLRTNREWTSAYLNGDKAKSDEMAQLHKWAYPEVG